MHAGLVTWTDTRSYKRDTFLRDKLLCMVPDVKWVHPFKVAVAFHLDSYDLVMILRVHLTNSLLLITPSVAI